MPVRVRRAELFSSLSTGFVDWRAGGCAFTVGPFGPAALSLCDGTGGVSTEEEPDCA